MKEEIVVYTHLQQTPICYSAICHVQPLPRSAVPHAYLQALTAARCETDRETGGLSDGSGGLAGGLADGLPRND